MKRVCLKIIMITSLFFSQMVLAQTEKDDVYSQCVDSMIDKMKLQGINNGVVSACSNHSRSIYEKQIVSLLDRIKKQSQEYQQPERYTDILKSQRLWKSYIDQECRNAGAYVGSPMYEFCPMVEYKNRVDQLQEYLGGSS